MLHDNLGVFSDAQAISAAAASTNYVDIGQTYTQLGVGTPIFLCIRTNTAPTAATDTLSIEVQMDDNGDFSSAAIVFMPLCGAAGAEVLASDARLATAGKWIWRAPLPYELTERYMRLYYNNTVTDGVFTVDAWLEQGPPSDFGHQVTDSPVGNP